MRRAQMSPEYIYFLAIVIIIALVYVGLLTDSLQFFSSEDDNSKYRRNLQVGILQIIDNGDNTSIYLVNNHRENITINDIELNNISLSVSGNIGAGEANEFVSLQTGFPSEVSIWMNYSIDAEDILFTTGSITFQGVQK